MFSLHHEEAFRELGFTSNFCLVKSSDNAELHNVERVGIYGGTFDPVHLGHLLVAKAAMEEMELDRLFFVPAARSPFKPHSEPTLANWRLRMLRCALVGQEQCEVDDFEIQRGGTSFTIDTVQHFRQQFPAASLFYLIGADHVNTLPKWRSAKRLAKLVEFIVIPRPGERINNFPSPFIGQSISGFPLAISSSQVRNRIKEGKSIHWLISPEVEEVIYKNQLYI